MRWLVVAGAGGAAEDLADRIAAGVGGARVVIARDGSSGSNWKSTVWDFVTQPAPRATTHTRDRTGIIYLQLVVADVPPRSPKEDPDAVLAPCRALLDLCGMLPLVPGNPLSLLICSLDQTLSGAVAGVSPTCAPLWALARVAMAEKPDLPLTLVSLDNSDIGDRCLQHILAETVSIAPGEQIHYRDGTRFRTRLQPYLFPVTHDKLRLRKDRSYLLAGYAGAQLEACARWLLALGAGRVLMAVSNGDTTPDFLGTLGGGDAAHVMRRVELSDNVACVGFLRTTGDPARPLGGVLYIPGVMDDGILENQSWNRFRDAVAPVVSAASNLSAATMGEQPDFFVCFFSSAAVMGTQGQASYAAACGFLDAFCRQLSSTGRSALSINWGPWASVVHWSGLKSKRPDVSAVRKEFQRVAMSCYRPRPYVGEVTLFVSERNSFNFERPADLGWIAYAKGGLVIHQLPGDHHGVMRGEAVQSMARIVTPHL